MLPRILVNSLPKHGIYVCTCTWYVYMYMHAYCTRYSHWTMKTSWAMWLGQIRLTCMCTCTRMQKPQSTISPVSLCRHSCTSLLTKMAYSCTNRHKSCPVIHLGHQLHTLDRSLIGRYSQLVTCVHVLHKTLSRLLRVQLSVRLPPLANTGALASCQTSRQLSATCTCSCTASTH